MTDNKSVLNGIKKLKQRIQILESNIKDSTKVDERMQGKFIPLYNTVGKHVLSILICIDEDGYDLATPNGKVLYCGVCPDLVDIFIETMDVNSL